MLYIFTVFDSVNLFFQLLGPYWSECIFCMAFAIKNVTNEISSTSNANLSQNFNIFGLERNYNNSELCHTQLVFQRKIHQCLTNFSRVCRSYKNLSY